MKRLLLATSVIALCFASLSCQLFLSHSNEPLAGQEQLVTRENVDAAVEFERAFRLYYGIEATAGENWFVSKSGTATVLVVAGHATAQTREGKIKAADRGPGSLAIMLHQLAKTPVLYTTYESPSDPNYYDDNAFKEALSRLIQDRKPVLVLDLHASKASHPYDVDFGTMGGKSLLGHQELLTRLTEALTKEGMSKVSQDFFSAEHHQTVTKWVANQGVPCIQLEINSAWLLRDEKADPHRFAQLLEGLIKFVKDVDANPPH
jgi:hypothetical protein